ncbi:MAG: hypothetical protein ABSF94_19180 [Steroidobacteraceae bacterium]|jgi:hypothetical protein
MSSLPSGMSDATLNYLITFTVAHEGDTPFMYNNWPLKNPNKDVTVGVGRAIDDENMAASAEIRSMFTVKATGLPASPQEMKTEFRRVYDLARTADNLHSDFEAKSPLKMDRGAMLRSLADKLLNWWDQKGQSIPDFAAIPAQAQVALMSYNYGARLRTAPKMCAAVNSKDFTAAAKESLVPGWDPQKNAAHNKLFMNAAMIVAFGRDVATLPPVIGPFKPPPDLDLSFLYFPMIPLIVRQAMLTRL